MLWLRLCLRFGDENFNATIACTTCCITIAGDRFAAATAVNMDTLWRNATTSEVIAGARSAVEGQWVIDGIAAGAIGMADDGHGSCLLYTSDAADE